MYRTIAFLSRVVFLSVVLVLLFLKSAHAQLGWDWEQVGTLPLTEWEPPAFTTAPLEFEGKIWIGVGGNRWYSSDYTTWYQSERNTQELYVLSTGPVSKPDNQVLYGQARVVFQDEVWGVGGVVQNLGDLIPTYVNEVWRGNAKVARASGLGARGNATLAVFGGSMYLFGGKHVGLSGATVNYYAELNDILRSADGEHWETIAANAPFSANKIQCVAEFDGKLWLRTSADDPGSLWMTADGVHWEQVSIVGAPATAGDYRMGVLGGTLWMFHGNGSGNAPDVLNSTDGIHWNAVGSTWLSSLRTGMATVAFNNYIWILGGGSLGGSLNDVWRSQDGVQWEQVTAHAPWPSVSVRCVVHNGSLFVFASGTVNDVLEIWSSSDGSSWNKVSEMQMGYALQKEMSAVSFAGRLWIFSGYEYAFDKLVWSSTNGVAWDQRVLDAGVGITTNLACTVFDNRIWIAGGVLNYVWSDCDQFSYVTNDLDPVSTRVLSSSNGVDWRLEAEVPAAEMQPFDHGVLLGTSDRLWYFGGLEWSAADGHCGQGKLNSKSIRSGFGGKAWTPWRAQAPWDAENGAGVVAMADQIFVLGGDTFPKNSSRKYYGDVWKTSGKAIDYTTDVNEDGTITLAELMRVISIYNTPEGFHCEAGTEDGYALGVGDETCAGYTADLDADWHVSLSELLRVIQFYVSRGFVPCAEGEDGYCPKNSE